MSSQESGPTFALYSFHLQRDSFHDSGMLSTRKVLELLEEYLIAYVGKPERISLHTGRVSLACLEAQFLLTLVAFSI